MELEVITWIEKIGRRIIRSSSPYRRFIEKARDLVGGELVLSLTPGAKVKIKSIKCFKDKWFKIVGATIYYFPFSIEYLLKIEEKKAWLEFTKEKIIFWTPSIFSEQGEFWKNEVIGIKAVTKKPTISIENVKEEMKSKRDFNLEITNGIISCIKKTQLGNSQKVKTIYGHSATEALFWEESPITYRNLWGILQIKSKIPSPLYLNMASYAGNDIFEFFNIGWEINLKDMEIILAPLANKLKGASLLLLLLYRPKLKGTNLECPNLI